MLLDQRTTAGVTWRDEGVFVHLANVQGFCHDHSLGREESRLTASCPAAIMLGMKYSIAATPKPP